MIHDEYRALRAHLETLDHTLHELERALGLCPHSTTQAPANLSSWRLALRRNVLPALSFDLPALLVAVCGGGSTGKSTLFNLLAGRRLSQVAFKAGLTRRVLLAGHPRVLTSERVAAALLHRLPQAPIAWHEAEDCSVPGPPLYAVTETIPPHLLLIDTPDFDTGDGSGYANRRFAEPILRTSEVIVYTFTNAVYSNAANTRFMAEVVGGIGGRPLVLVYRISRAAPDELVIEHCQQVARQLFGDVRGEFPPEIMGVYRIHESDRVAEGRAQPEPRPLGKVTAGRALPELLAALDAAAIKRHVFAGDLRGICKGARRDLARARATVAHLDLYRRVWRHIMVQHALEALQAFPAGEAIALATELFTESSPPTVRALRRTGRFVGAPLRAVQGLVRRFEHANGPSAPPGPNDLPESLGQSLLLAANALRNRLLDTSLIVRASRHDAILEAARAALNGRDLPEGALRLEAVDHGVWNIHLNAPDLVAQQLGYMAEQDWPAVAHDLQAAADGLIGLPGNIRNELRQAVLTFRGRMSLGQRLREVVFASLSALPPLLGVTYTLLTADPVTGTGIWVQLGGLFGVNDLWALVSIPASAGLSDQDRHQLELMITPVFRVWLERRVAAIVSELERTVCRPISEALEGLPATDDARFHAVDVALDGLEMTE